MKNLLLLTSVFFLCGCSTPKPANTTVPVAPIIQTSPPPLAHVLFFPPTPELLAGVDTKTLNMDSSGVIMGDIYNSTSKIIVGDVLFHVTVRNHDGTVIGDRKIKEVAYWTDQRISPVYIKTGIPLDTIAETWECTLEVPEANAEHTSALNPAAQALYDSANQRGILARDAEAAAIAHELENRGMVHETPTPVSVPSGPPIGAIALCNDGTYSYSQRHQGTCSKHGGVAEWYK